MEPPAYYDNDDDDQLQAEQDAAAGPSVEQVFEGEPVPTPSEMFTARSVAVGVVLGSALSLVGIKMTLTAGNVPLLTVPAGLLGFFLSRAWTRLLDGFEVPQLPFTRQENAVIQAFVVACSNVAYTGGFGSNLLAMSRNAAADGGAYGGAKNVDEPSIAKLIAFLFLTSFAGMFAVMPFRNSLVIRHHLTFPTGTATAHLINSMHTPHGAQQASKQISVMFKTFAGTVCWQLWQWFFSGGGDQGCGFQSFPIFGLAAAARGFVFDFSMTNVGVGLFSPCMITISMLLGSVISYGILLPYVEAMQGVIGISMVLADGAFNLLCILLRTLRAMRKRQHSQLATQPFMCLGVDDRPPARCFDDRRRAQVFLRDRVCDPAAAAGYVALSAVSIFVVPYLYPQLRPVHVAVAYLVAPVFTFCNAYGVGVTDVSVSSSYGRIVMFGIGYWVGLQNGGVVAGLAAGIIVMAAASTASDLMQMFRTGYLTLTSPHAVLISQVAGTALGCLVNPIIFWVLYHGYGEVTVPPYAKMYREMAMIAMSDLAGFPRQSLLLCKVAFAVALANSALREVSARRGWRIGRYLPCTIAVGVGFFLPPRIAIGMFFGTVVKYLWRRLDADGARAQSVAVAAGLICGDAVGALLLSMLWILNARPPICIVFLSRSDSKNLDALLAASPTSSS